MLKCFVVLYLMERTLVIFISYYVKDETHCFASVKLSIVFLIYIYAHTHFHSMKIQKKKFRSDLTLYVHHLD